MYRDPANMKITPAKRRLLLAMLEAEPKGQDAIHRAAFRADPNSTCYASLQEYRMVEPPGVLTDEGRQLACELQAENEEPKPGEKYLPDFIA